MNKLILIYLNENDVELTAEYSPCEDGCGAYAPYVIIHREDVNDAWCIPFEEEPYPIIDTEEVIADMFNDEFTLIDVRVINECLLCGECE